MSQVATPLWGRGKRFLRKLRKNLKVEGRKVAEWCRLVGKENKPAQVAQVSLGGRGNKGGGSEAARQLGLDRDDVRRAIAVVALSLAGQK